MFVIVTMRDDVCVKPCDLKPCMATPDKDGGKGREYLNAKVLEELQFRFLDRVIPGVGLVASVYKLVKIGDWHIHPGDDKYFLGQVNYDVTFQLLVFRPAKNQWLTGQISRASEEGLHVTLGFFSDVLVPPANMEGPVYWKNDTWMWLCEGEEYFYEVNKDIRFQCDRIKYASAEEMRHANTIPAVILWNVWVPFRSVLPDIWGLPRGDSSLEKGQVNKSANRT